MAHSSYDELIERLLKLSNGQLDKPGSGRGELVGALEDGVEYLEESERETGVRLQLQREWQQKIREYSDKIQSLTAQKNLKIPFLIHKETATCIADFHELSTTLYDNIRKNERLNTFYKQSSKINQKLVQDLDLVTNYLSFIDDKLVEISDSGDRLLEEKRNVTEELRASRERIGESRGKYEGVLSSVNERRAQMRTRERELEEELLRKRSLLENVRQSKNNELSLIQKTKSLLWAKEKEVGQLQGNLSSTAKERDELAGVLKDEEKKLSAAAAERSANRESVAREESQLERRIAEYASRIAEMERESRENEGQLKDLRKEEGETNLKIDEFAGKRTGLEEAVLNQETIRAHVEREIEANLQEIEEVSNGLLALMERRDDLQTEYYNCTANRKNTDESFSREILSLKEALGNTIARKSMLEAAINATKKELRVFDKENQVRTRLLLNKHGKLRELGDRAEEERNQARDRLGALQKQVAEIQAQLDHVLDQQNGLRGEPQRRLNSLKRQFIQLQEERAHQGSRIEGLREHIRHIRREIGEVDINLHGMTVLTENLHLELTRANYELSNLKDQSEYSRRALEDQKRRHESGLAQMSALRAVHEANCSELLERNSEICREINSLLGENECLAEEFKQLNLEIFEKKISATEFYGTLFELGEFNQLLREIKNIVRQWVAEIQSTTELDGAHFSSQLHAIMKKSVNNDINDDYFIGAIGQEFAELGEHAKGT